MALDVGELPPEDDPPEPDEREQQEKEDDQGRTEALDEGAKKGKDESKQEL